MAKSIDYDVLSSAKNKELETNEKWGLAEESEYFASKVKLYRQDKLNADEFRRFRLQNGAYGSRLNSEFSMIRIKVPGGDITPTQARKDCQSIRIILNRICSCIYQTKYSNALGAIGRCK